MEERLESASKKLAVEFFDKLVEETETPEKSLILLSMVIAMIYNEGGSDQQDMFEMVMKFDDTDKIIKVTIIMEEIELDEILNLKEEIKH